MLTWETPVMLASSTASNKKLAFLTLLIIFSPILLVKSQQQIVPGSDADCLLKFKETLTNGSVFSSWDPSTTPCNQNMGNWFGVLCFNDQVWGIQLEGLRLAGKLNVESLAPMKYLRTLSFMNNNFNGPMPQVKSLGSLKSLYLSNNRFTGEIPADGFNGMLHLKKIVLANNAFRGKIPSSLASLPMLLEVRLNGNQFEGEIPDFKQNLKLVSFENNNLEGPIPENLQNMDAGSFAGNKALCNSPLSSCSADPESPPLESPPPESPPSPKKNKNKNKTLYIIAFVLIIVGIILVTIALVFCVLHIRRRRVSSPYPSPAQNRTEKQTHVQAVEKEKVPQSSVPGHARRRSGSDSSNLLFLHDDIQRFDLQDLLRASAEVLGSGSFGGSYKAAINHGQTLVVKRYKHMNNVGKDEFHEHMRLIGRLNHPNLLPVLAYYYRREEKLLVAEYMTNRSLASHLHANHSEDQPGLNWPTRLKIIKGVAKGLGYLYTELPNLTIPHGHLKSSNVVLDESFEPLLTDYTLRPVMNSEQSHNLMIAYKSPEYSATGHITKKTDVWCLGVLILEVLTGRFPENYLCQGYDAEMSLVTWVSNMVKEKKTGDVFDKEMTANKNCKASMINLLKIGLSCCEEDEERRVEMMDAVEGIERLRGEFDDDLASTMPNVFASRLDDEFNLTRNRL